MSSIKGKATVRSDWVRTAGDFARFLSRCFPSRPSIAFDFEKSVTGCRAAVDFYIDKVLQVASNPDPTGHDRRWLSPTEDLHREVSNTLMAIGRITAVLESAHFRGQDPSKIDNLSQKLVRAGHKRRADGQLRSDTLRRMRVGNNLSIAPRFEDPRVGERWLSGAVRRGLPVAFHWLVRLARATGARSSSLLPLTLADMLIGAPKHGEIKAPHRKNKKRPTITLVMSDALYADLETWIDAELQRRFGLGLAHYRKLAAVVLKGGGSSRAEMNRRRQCLHTLKSIRLFVLDEVPITYPQLAKAFRAVALAEGLTYRPDKPTDRPRSIVFHHLRHEYVFLRLEDIAGCDSDKREGLRQALADYMGWARGAEMLAWYSQHYENLFGITEAHAAADRIENAAMSPPALDQVGPVTSDPVLEGFFS